MGTPIVWQTHGVEIKPGPMNFFATAWASPDRLLIAAWNDTDEDNEIEIALNQQILAKYGITQAPGVKFHIINSADCEVKETKDVNQAEPYLIKGKLSAKTLLLVESIAK